MRQKDWFGQFLINHLERCCKAKIHLGAPHTKLGEACNVANASRFNKDEWILGVVAERHAFVDLSVKINMLKSWRRQLARANGIDKVLRLLSGLFLQGE